MAINPAGSFLTMVFVGMPVALSIPLALFDRFVAAFIPAIGTYLGSVVPIVMTLAVQGLVPALMRNGAVAFGAASPGVRSRDLSGRSSPSRWRR